MTKRLITFMHALRSLALLVCIFVSNLTWATQGLQVEYGTGFERITHLRNDGQSYYLLSKNITQLRTNYVMKGKRHSLDISMKKTTANYTSGESVVLNTDDAITNQGYSMKYRYGTKNSFTFELGQENKIFITETDGYNLTLESLATTYSEFGGRSYLIFGSGSALSLSGYYRYYFPGTVGIEKTNFNIVKANGWGGELRLEFGRYHKKGFNAEMFFGVQEEQFEESTHFQTRTEQVFGASISFQF